MLMKLDNPDNVRSKPRAFVSDVGRESVHQVLLVGVDEERDTSGLRLDFRKTILR